MYPSRGVLLFLLPFIFLQGYVLKANARLSQPRHLQDTAPGRLPNFPVYETVTLNAPGGCSGDQQAFLDIYRSSNSNSTTVLHLPGGAYMNLVGDTVESAGAAYLEAGYSLAVLYYRLPRNASYQNWLVCSDPNEALSDVTAAINTIRTNHQEYNVNPDAIVVSGFSAGGHLAALYGTTCIANSCPNALALHFPFLETGAKIFCTNVGSAFSNNDDYDDCQPTFLVDKATPPTVLYHADGDSIVPTLWMTEFVQALEENGIDHEYYEVPGGGHYMVPFDQVAAVSNGVLDANDGYASLITRSMMLSSPICSRCDNQATDWMKSEGQSCETGTWQIQNKCNEDPTWISAGYCRKSCFEAGRGYYGDGNVCCPDDTTMEEECTTCDDTPTTWMTSNNQTCDTATWSIQNKCNADASWQSAGYCRKSCFDAGRGYSDDNCCSNSCTECDNTPTNYMTSQGQTCETGTWYIQNNCQDNTVWVDAGYCRKSCFEAARGYEGDDCCSGQLVI